MRALVSGLVAGAAGTTALNAVTYLDMAIRGRPASSTPEQSVERLTDLAGIDLGDEPRAANRRAGLGPLLGYATGIGTAVAYAMFARRRRNSALSAAALTVAAMAASNAPMTLLGLTDPRRWSAADWASDIVPHAAYGAVAALTLRLLEDPSTGACAAGSR
jgi:hypothetical protein